MTENREITYTDLGLVRYKEAWDRQEMLFNLLMAYKLTGEGDPGQHLVFCEHYPVFTLGKSGSQANLLINKELLAEKGIDYYRINRGGDITFHGPGQIVGYPIIDLDSCSLGIRQYVHLLEDAVIRLLEEYGIAAGRLSGATGVWLDADKGALARKICAIGVRASRGITMHGFAFNVNTDLSYYTFINPCGFTDKGVTSMERELNARQDLQQVKVKLRNILISLLSGH